MASTTGATLKTNYAVSSKIEAFYTGGKVQFSHDEEHLFCSCTDKVQVLHIETGKVVQSLKEESDTISCFAASPDDLYLVTASKNLLLRQWDWKNGEQTKTWKAVHVAPISSMAFDETSTLLATGSSDSTIKVWDIIRQYYTHSLKGSSGVVSLVQFHPNPKILQLFSASNDCKIRIWDLVKSRCLGVLESHYSVVTSLAFNDDHSTMISASRDNALNVWDLKDVFTPKRKPPKTIPCFEGVESVIMLPKGVTFPKSNGKDGEYFITAGNKGKLRFWSLKDGKCVYEQTAVKFRTQEDDSELQQLIVQASFCRTRNAVSVVTFDHNVILYDLETMKTAKQFVGYNDDILDMGFAGPDNDHLAVITNSDQMRLYNMKTMDCRMMEGHSKIILSLDVSTDGTRIVTGAKDHTIRIWSIEDDSSTKCLAVGKGHTHAVGSVAWSRTSNNFVVSGSQDFTLKVWDVPTNASCESSLVVKMTEKAHDKDINSVAVSPNDKLIATGSQDKTAKIWRTTDGGLVGVVRGHKRGIWCVKFSPVDRVIATASGDSTIKIWSLADFTCVKTFEGHTSSVLKVMFVSRGMQLISSGSDGLVKLWTIKTNECIKTFDEHTDKVWSVASNNAENTLVSGGADSVINIWMDVTEEEQRQAQEEAENLILKEQELSNLLHENRYSEAICLAITLEQPFRVLKIIKDMLEAKNGLNELTRTMKGLREDQIDSILKFIVEWNTNAKNAFATQTVLSIILKNFSPYELAEKANMKDTLESLLPYTERHMKRINRLLQQSEFVEYTWQRMKLSTPVERVRTHGSTSEIAEETEQGLDTRVSSGDTHPRDFEAEPLKDDTVGSAGRTGSPPTVERLHGMDDEENDSDMEYYQGGEGEVNGPYGSGDEFKSSERRQREQAQLDRNGDEAMEEEGDENGNRKTLEEKKKKRKKRGKSDALREIPSSTKKSKEAVPEVAMTTNGHSEVKTPKQKRRTKKDKTKTS